MQQIIYTIASTGGGGGTRGDRKRGVEYNCGTNRWDCYRWDDTTTTAAAAGRLYGTNAVMDWIASWFLILIMITNTNTIMIEIRIGLDWDGTDWDGNDWDGINWDGID